MTRHAQCLPVRAAPEKLEVAAMRRDVVDHPRRLPTHDADGMRREIGGAFRLPLARIATLARRRAVLVVPRLALTVGLFAALATDAWVTSPGVV